MSGPSWLPPKTLGSPDRNTAAMSHPGPALYRPPMKGLPDQRPKYSMYDQNGAPGGNGMPVRYMATGPPGAMQHQLPDDRSGPTSYHPIPPQQGERYYVSGPGPKEDHHSWNPRMPNLDLHNRGPEKHISNIDAEIDSLTCMLADLDGHQSSSLQLYDNVPYSKHLPMDRYNPPNHMGAPPPSRPSMGYPVPLQNQYHPAPPYPSTAQQDYVYSSASSSVHKPYPQPVPASYTTASTPTGPRFTVQVKTAQPVIYSQSGRQAEQAYTPSPPRQHPSRPLQQELARPHYEPKGQGWYPAPPPPAQEPHGDPAAYRGAGNVPGGRVVQGAPVKKSQEQVTAYHANKVSDSRPEEELDRLTKKLVYDMNHPPTEEYFGRCAGCGDNVLGDGSGCIAMEQVFHVDCFTCVTCHARLRGKPFYALERKSYCESCYISTLERCSKCSEPILDRILRAMGKAYHPHCFTCVVCGCCLDGVPFTVDATSQIHCIDDFHRKFAPRCSVCCLPIMPEPGQEETVRIVALDRSFHVNCYVCEECGLLLSSEGEGRGCYPLDGHILCKSCSARRIQDLSAKISTDC